MNFLARQASRANMPPHLLDEYDRVVSMVEKCTSEMLLSIDWTQNMELVDFTNNTASQDIRREVARQVRKRLQSRNPRVVSLALSLIETLVKNCHTSFHREVATPKFMAVMGRLARSHHDRTGKESLEVSDKAIDLIQSWGEAFLPQSHTMPLFSQTYQELRREGVPFKAQYDASKAPVLTPPATVPTRRNRSRSDEDLLKMGETSVTMLSDFLQNATSFSELSADGTFQDILDTCMKMVRTLQSSIETKVMADEEDLTDYFAINDALQSTLQLYEGIRSGAIQLPLPKPEGASGAISHEDLDDFLAGGPAPSEPPKKLSASDASIPALPKPPEKDPIPRLPPSRRDSFGKSRASRYSRGHSAGNDLLDLSSMDQLSISSSVAGGDFLSGSTSISVSKGQAGPYSTANDFLSSSVSQSQANLTKTATGADFLSASLSQTQPVVSKAPSLGGDFLSSSVSMKPAPGTDFLSSSMTSVPQSQAPANPFDFLGGSMSASTSAAVKPVPARQGSLSGSLGGSTTIPTLPPPRASPTSPNPNLLLAQPPSTTVASSFAPTTFAPIVAPSQSSTITPFSTTSTNAYATAPNPYMFASQPAPQPSTQATQPYASSYGGMGAFPMQAQNAFQTAPGGYPFQPQQQQQQPGSGYPTGPQMQAQAPAQATPAQNPFDVFF